MNIAHERWNNQTKPFTDVVDLSRERHAQMSPEDRFTHLNKYAYANIEGRNALAALRRDSEGNQFLGMLTDHAFDQLAHRVAPTRNFCAYAKACPANLRTINMNYWLHHNGNGDKDALLRSCPNPPKRRPTPASETKTRPPCPGNRRRCNHTPREPPPPAGPYPAWRS